MNNINEYLKLSMLLEWAVNQVRYYHEDVCEAKENYNGKLK